MSTRKVTARVRSLVRRSKGRGTVQHGIEGINNKGWVFIDVGCSPVKSNGQRTSLSSVIVIVVMNADMRCEFFRRLVAVWINVKLQVLKIR